MATLADLVVRLSLKDGISKELDGVATKLNGVASDFRKVGAGLTAGVTLPVVAMGVKLVSAASDLNEAQSAVNTVFGDSANIINDYAKTSATALGVSQSAYLGAASGLGALFTGMGLSDKTSADFSSNILQNASDLASFYNTDPGTALSDLQSGLVGEAEPLRKYGILLSETAVQQKAMEQTGKDNAKQLTESEKVTARYALIQEQLGAAQGDFARTSNGLANQQRILKAQLADTAAQLGQVLLPYVLRAVKAFSGLIMWVKTLSPTMQKVAVIAGVVAAAMGPLLLVLGTMIPAITALIPLFAALLGPLGLVVAAIALLSAAYIGNWWGFRDAVNGVGKSLIKLSKTKTFQRFLGGLEEALLRPLNAMKKMVTAFGGIGKAILSGDFKGALQQGRKFLAGFGDFLGSPAKAIGQFLKGIQTGFKPLDDVLHTIGKLATDWGRLIQEVFQGDLSGALDVAGRMFGHFGDLASGVFDLLKAGFNAIDWGALVSGLGDIAETIGTWLADNVRRIPWGTIWETAKDKGKDLVGYLGDLAVELGTWLGQQVSAIDWGAIWSLAQDKGKDLVGYLGSIASRITDWLKLQVAAIDWIGVLSNIASKIAEALPDSVTDGIDAIGDALTGVKDAAQTVADTIGSILSTIKMAFDTYIAPIKSVIDGLVTAWTSFKSVLPDSILGHDVSAGAPAQRPTGGASMGGSTMGGMLDIGRLMKGNTPGLTGNIVLPPDTSLYEETVNRLPGILGQAMSDALGAVTPYAMAITSVLGQSMSDALASVTTYMTAITTAIGQGMSDSLSSATTYSNAIYTTVSSNIGRMVGNVSALVGAIPGIVTSAMNTAANDGGAAAYNAGLAIGGGLANGMDAMIGQVQQKANELANAATSAARAALIVQSPSRVFHQIGAYVGEGFANGIESRYAMAARAGNGLAAAAIPGIGGSGSGAMGRGGGFTNYGTIRVEAPSPEDFYAQWRQQQIGGVRR